MLIHSYDRSLHWVRGIERGVASVLNDGFELSPVYLDVRRVAASQKQRAVSRALARFRSWHPDLVITTDDFALANVGPAVVEQVPLIFAGVNGSLDSDFPWVAKHANVTGILERPLLRRSLLESLRAMGVHQARVLMLLGDDPVGRATAARELDDASSFVLAGDVAVTVHRSGSLDGWKRAVEDSKREGYDFLYLVSFHNLQDSQKRQVEPDDVVQWLARHAPLPALTIHNEHIGPHRLLGGMVIDAERLGRQAGELAWAVLREGKVPRALPVSSQNSLRLRFSASLLMKWNLTISPSYSNRVDLLR